jgi:hypothetical protein
MIEDATTRAKLPRLAALITEKNRLERKIAELVGRRGESGHVGEFIASLVFDIDVHESAAVKARDGYFRSGPLGGRA